MTTAIQIANHPFLLMIRKDKKKRASLTLNVTALFFFNYVRKSSFSGAKKRGPGAPSYFIAVYRVSAPAERRAPLPERAPSYGSARHGRDHSDCAGCGKSCHPG